MPALPFHDIRVRLNLVWRQVLHTAGASGYGIAMSVVSLFVTARVLGPEGRGLFVAANAWVGVLGTFGSLSLGQVAIHVAAGRSREEWLPDVAGSTGLILAAVVLVTWIGVAATYVATGGEFFRHLSPGILALAMLALPFMVGAEAARYLLNAADALRMANVAQMAGATAGALGVVVCVVVLRGGVPGALVASLLAVLTSAAFSVIHLRRLAGTFLPSLAMTRRLVGGSLRLHMSTIGTYLFSQASVLLLNNYRPPAETAYFQLAMQLFGMALIGSTAIGAVAFGLVAREGPDGAWPQQRRLLAQALGLISIVAVVAYFAAPIAIRLVAGADFMPVVPLFRWLLLGLLGATFSSAMASQWIGRGLFWQAAVLTLVVGLLSLGTTALLVPRMGVNGALIGTLVAYAISIVGNGIMAFWVQLRVTGARFRVA